MSLPSSASAQRVLITGGGVRLGAVLVEHFARAGWEVWCHHHASGAAAQALAARLQALGLRVHTVQADLAVDASRRAMLDHIGQQAGPLHCLVNNASLFEPDTGESVQVSTMQQQLEVNLVAPLVLGGLMAQQLPPDTPAGSCSIIHVLDQKVFNLNPDYFSYTVTKLALERSVALQAQALAPRLRVCGVAPGLMFVSGPQTQENFDAACRVNLLERAIDPAQVAATCVFLAGNPCITGTTISVDNGQHLVPLRRDVMFEVDTPTRPLP
jgi:NAD(P)-dependent dehydrogenase (short-subunit alcohol dehydrogenase family)